MTAATNLRCRECHRDYPLAALHVCEFCFGPLEVTYDYEAIRRNVSRASIEAGYDRALPSILDSNITTLLSGIILFQFGSGPIRGFAVTLCVGLVIHVFTAVFCTRVVWDYLLSRRRLQTVSI